MFHRFVVVATIALALTGTADAAQRRAAGQRAERRNERQDRVGQRLQQRFNLNDTQMNGVRTLQESRKKEMQALRQELRQNRDTSQDLRRESRDRRRDINQRFKSGVRGLLTPDQLQRTPRQK
jgi:hypothetical protein